MKLKLFMEIHRDMPRQGPGSEAATRRALESIPDVPRGVRVLDIGCGPGQQTLELARFVRPLGGEVIAVDFHEPYLDQLRRAVDDAGIENVTCRTGDMFDLQFDDASFDILWSEGAIYIVGFEKGLTEWKRLLKPEGFLAVTEISWLEDPVPEEVRAFWAEGYPPMQSISDNLETAERCGWRVLNHFTLPRNAWFDDYYDPLEKRIDLMKEQYSDTPEALELLTMEAAEIELYRNHSNCYGYEFFVLQQK